MALRPVEGRVFLDLMTYLARATPDQWHQVAWNWNWDAGTAPLRWIIRQPNCDRGTALLVYWYGGPRFLAQYETRDEVPEFALEHYDLTMEIERAYLAGAYTRQEIAFDPRADRKSPRMPFDWTAEYANLPNHRPIPDLMYLATPGREVECDRSFDDGFPPGVSPDVSPDE